jgi:hypothetical protein
VRDQIFAAIEAKLGAITPLPRIDVEPAGDPSKFPSLAIYDGGHRVLERDAVQTRREMTVTIEGYVESGDGSTGAALRNALHASVVKALMTDSQLGGLVELVEDTDYRPVTATLSSKRRLAFGQDFIIEFSTSRTDPAEPA